MATTETSSTRFDAPLSLDLIPSRQLRWLVWFMMLGAVSAIALSPMVLLLKLSCGILLMAFGGWRWRRLITRYPAALHHMPERGWALLVAEKWIYPQTFRCYYLTAHMILVDVAYGGNGRLRFPLLADQTDVESWRRLRRRISRTG